MQKESIGLSLGLLLLFIGYIAVQNFYLHRPAQNNTPLITDADKKTPSLNATAYIKPIEKPENVNLLALTYNADDAKLTTPYANFSFTEKGGCLANNELIKEHTAYDDHTPISVITNYNLCKAFGFKLDDIDLRTENAGLIRLSANSVKIIQRTADLEISRTFNFSEKDDYFGDFKIDIRNLTAQTQNKKIAFDLGASSDNKHSGGMFSSTPPQFNGVAINLADNSVKREDTPFVSSPEHKIILNENQVFPNWLNTNSLYWMNSIIPQFHSPINFFVVRTGFNLMQNINSEIDQTVYEAWVEHPITLQAYQSQNFNYKIYFGPKDETILKRFDQYHLSSAIDYGFFKIVAKPLYYSLDFIQSIVKNWGIAIVILTILINIIFIPLQIKSYNSAQKMQLIQPQIKELQAKYKDDKHSLHKESMALMAKNGVNPFSGCLPLLPQIPVFFGLNSAFQHTFALRQSPFFFWIHDLTRPDPYFILPILMALLMIGYQKMIPMPSMDAMQAKVMHFLPIIFSLFMLMYPTGLALYVITNTIVSMLRQFFFTRHLKHAL